MALALSIVLVGLDEHAGLLKWTNACSTGRAEASAAWMWLGVWALAAAVQWVAAGWAERHAARVLDLLM